MTTLDWWAGASPSYEGAPPPYAGSSAPARNQSQGFDPNGRVIFGAFEKWDNYPSPLAIVGIDGKEYVIYPSALLILPKVNAEILEKAKIGKVLAPYVESEKDFLEILQEGDDWDLSNALYQSLDYDNPKLVLKAIQESAVYQLKAKLYDNPDQFFVLKMLKKGINPLKVKAELSSRAGSSLQDPQLISTVKEASTSMQNEDHEHTDKEAILHEPPRSGYLEQYRFDEFYGSEPIKVDEVRQLPAFSGGLGNREVLHDFLEGHGLNLVLKVKGKKFKAVREVIDKDWAILEADFTKLEVHEDYRALMLRLGFEEKDLMAVVGFEDWECPNCGIHVFKPFVDAEERDGKWIVRSGRVHPVNKNAKTRKYAYEQLKKLEFICEAVLRKGLYVFRKGLDGEYKAYECSDKSLALLDLVLTIPEDISKSLADYLVDRLEKAKVTVGFGKCGEIREISDLAKVRREIYGELIKVLRRAVKNALEEFLEWYLVEVEGYPKSVVENLRLGFWLNFHLWGSAYVDKHVHAHVLMPNFVVCDGLFVRFNPYLTKSSLKKLRELWYKHLKKALSGFSGFEVWGYMEDFEKYDELVIYNKYIRLTLKDGTFVNAGRVIHKFKYNVRKVHNDLNNAFWGGRLKLDGLDYEWIEVCLLYDNRTVPYGFIKDWRKVFEVDGGVWAKIVKAERKEICPFCNSEMVLVGRFWLYEVLEEFSKLIYVYYFNGHWYLEFWKKRDGGGDLNG